MLPLISILLASIFWFGFALLAYRSGAKHILKPFCRLPADVHWSERARQFHPAVRYYGYLIAVLFVAGAIGGGGMMTNFGLHFLFGALPIGAASFFGVALAYGKVWIRSTGRTEAKGSLLDGLMVLFFISSSQYVIPLCAYLLMPHRWERGLVIAVLGTMALMWIYRTMLTIPMLRLLRVLKPADDALNRLVISEAEAAGLERPPVYLIETPVANAYAFTSNHSLAFTSGAIEAIDSEEGLRRIARHELAHLAESPAVRLIRSLEVVVCLPLLLLPAATYSFGVTGMLGCLAVILLLGRGFRRLRLRLESSADRGAVGEDEIDVDYAAALESIYRWNLMPAVLGRRRTHPHLYDRMTEAGVTPDFPRPDPPRMNRLLLPMFLASLVAVLLAIGLSLLPRMLTIE